MFSVVAGASVRETWQLQSMAESIVMYSFQDYGESDLPSTWLHINAVLCL
jgi:hypothetical protein